MNDWPTGSGTCRQLNFAALLSVFMIAAGIAAATSPANKQPPGQPIDLNTATIAQLEQLPGVGSGIAKAIVEFRVKSGPFRRVEDLLAIRGITKQRLEKIRPYVVVTNPQKT
ncbi:MAG TPA: helix-hairpin-helix domain-containing protein [Candidatus Acidoferrales bacterium]|nr:helix-hairpin-helix domain-containing protein [Candidatus Acidoferrales bacterium]